MFKKKLCPKCEMGKYTYELDKRSPMCPYIGCYSKKKCPMFIKLKKSKKDGALRWFTRKPVLLPPPRKIAL